MVLDVSVRGHVATESCRIFGVGAEKIGGEDVAGLTNLFVILR